MALDDDDIQAVVDIITKTGCYELNNLTFNFDLVQLEKATIEQLETFVAASTEHRRECISPQPLKKTWFQLTTNQELTNEENEESAVENDTNFNIETEAIRADGIKIEPIENKERKPTQNAINVERTTKRITKGIAAGYAKTEKAKRKNRKAVKVAGQVIQNKMKNKVTSEIQEKIQTEIGKKKKRIKKARRVKRAAGEFTVEMIDSRKNPNKRDDGTKEVVVDEVNVERVKKRKRNRCQICGRKQSAVDTRKKYVCLKCLKMRQKMLHADNVKVKRNKKKSKNGHCRKCLMNRNEIAANAVTATEPVCTATLKTFYNLCATLALSPKKPSWNGRVCFKKE